MPITLTTIICFLIKTNSARDECSFQLVFIKSLQITAKLEIEVMYVHIDAGAAVSRYLLIGNFVQEENGERDGERKMRNEVSKT